MLVAINTSFVMEDNKYMKSIHLDLKSLFVPYVYEAYVQVNLIEELGLENESPQRIREVCDEMVSQALTNSFEELYQTDVSVESIEGSLGEYIVKLSKRAVLELNLIAENCYPTDLETRLEYVVWFYRD